MFDVRHKFLLLVMLGLSVACGGPTGSGDPSAVGSAAQASGTAVRHGHLSLDVVSLAKGRHQLLVRDDRTGRLWVGEDLRDEAAKLKSSTRRADGWNLEILSHRTQTVFSVAVRFAADDRLQFTIDTADRSVPFPELPYPPAFQSDLKQGGILFCNRSSGIMLPQTDVWHRNKVLTTYGNTEALDMPWIGVVDGATGEGTMTVFDTPTESAIRFVAAANGLLWPQVQWFESKGVFSYPREASCTFFSEGGYVAQAIRFRADAMRFGLLSPLRDRERINSHVEWAKGAAIIWGSPGASAAREYRTYGIVRGILNAHGAIPPEELREMTAMGFLTGEYDSYTDIQDGPTGRQSDSVEEAAYRMADGAPSKGWRTPGGVQYYNRSSALAVRAASIVIPEILQAYPYTSRFIDVSPSLHFIEDFHPNHSFDRRQDMLNRQALFAYIRSLGLVVGGEHPKAWAARFFEYAEGNLSGSHWWKNPKAGNLQRYNDRSEIPAEYLNYGINHTLRVPLWDLVFHDTIIPTWYWGDSNGYLYNLAPEISDWKDAATILHGGAPLLWADHLCYGWNRNRDRFRQTVRNTTHFGRRVATSRMIDHRFLTEDRSVQRTQFAEPDGVAVVNFSAEPRPIDVEGQQLVLAPYGFYAKADDLIQSRLLVDGETVTNIAAKDYYFHESTSLNSVGPMIVQGRGELAQMGPDQWNLLVRSSAEVRVRLGDLGLMENSLVRLSRIESSGRRIAAAEFTRNGGELILPASGSEEALTTLELGVDSLATISYPDGGVINPETAIELVAGPTAARILYTLDGTDPTSASTLYSKPFILTRSTALKVRSADTAGHLGPVFATAFRVEKPLFDSGTVKPEVSPMPFEIPMQGVRKIEFVVTDAGDGLDYDSANLVNLRLMRADGTFASLTAMKPLTAVQSADKPVFDGKNMNIGGKNYPEGISTHAMATFVWEIDGEFVALSGSVGNDDRTKGRGSVRLLISGTY